MILCADVLEGLASLPAGIADGVVTDPPYGEKAASWDKPRTRDWHCAWLSEADRVLAPGAPLITFSSRRYLDVLMGAVRDVRGDSAGCPLQLGSWNHRQGHPVADGYLRPEHEPFVVSGKVRAEADDVRQMRVYRTPHNVARVPVKRNENARGFRPFTYVPHAVGPMAGTVIDCARNKPDEATGHPTQKPEEVIAYLVALACPPGGLVVDCFGGSGTTKRVALRLNRRAILIDNKLAYCAIAQQREYMVQRELLTAHARGARG